MKRVAGWLIAAAFGFGAACKKTDATEKKETAGGPAGQGSTAPAGSAASKGPVPVTATDFFAESIAAGGAAPDLKHKYDSGILLSGTVVNRIDDMGQTFIHLAAGEGKHVALTFIDSGAATRVKGVKVSDALVAVCREGGVGGPAQVIVGDCILQ